MTGSADGSPTTGSAEGSISAEGSAPADGSAEGSVPADGSAQGAAPAAGFAERFVPADGFDVRYLEAGEGPPIACLHGAGGLRLSPAHTLLAATYRVVAFEVPGFGDSAPNERSTTLRELAGTMRKAVAAAGAAGGSLWGTSFGAKLALWMAVDDPDALASLVLASPAAIRQEGGARPSPEQLAGMLYAHPERQPPVPPLPEAVAAKQRALTGRLMGPPRDPELEAAMRHLEVPTLVLFGSEDRLTPPELGRLYVELLPKGHLVIVYDAAHAIDADRPEAFAAVVGDFVEHRDGFLVSHQSSLLYP